MNIIFKQITEDNIDADILIIPLFENPSTQLYSDIDKLIDGLIQRVIESKEFTGKAQQLLQLHVSGIKAGRIILIGLGVKTKLTAEDLRRSGAKAFTFIEGQNLQHAAMSLTAFNDIKSFKARFSPIDYFIEGGLLSLYDFNRYKTEKPAAKKIGFNNLTLIGESKNFEIDKISIIAEAASLARDLANTPSNEMTPSILAQNAMNIANDRIKVKVLDKAEVEGLGMGAFIAVSKGSNEPLKFIIIEYSEGTGKPIALIGKSITFDSGGISIKPAQGMEQMKYDMSGGAAVIAAIKAADKLSLKMNIIGILPATENLSGGSATRPGDIVKSITGKTIEIINTDAEGRLILADGIGYAIKYYKPKYIIDIATLTGACSLALGNEAIAMMGNDQQLMEMIKQASVETYERVWQMPLYSEFAEYLKSDAADIKNTSGKDGSLVTAAWFLKEFAGTTKWAHLDIASTAWSTKETHYSKKGATGIGTRLLIEFLTIAAN
ncbi:MAG: leucyl aminopeptidase [Nitrospirae bacterium]|nr:leucyl aminopeptidase [Nitrospirota bacterium]